MERVSIPDRIKFLDYAGASCGEFRTQAIIGLKAHLIEEKSSIKWVEESRQISAMIQGLIRSQKHDDCQLITEN